MLTAMLHRGRGGVLNVGSIAAYQAGPYMSVYYASKAIVIPGWKNRYMVASTGFLPRFATCKLVAKMQSV